MVFSYKRPRPHLLGGWFDAAQTMMRTQAAATTKIVAETTNATTAPIAAPTADSVAASSIAASGMSPAVLIGGIALVVAVLYISNPKRKR